MKNSLRVSTCVPAVLALVIPVAAAQDNAQSDASKVLRVTGAHVSVVCPLTIGGSFEAKTKALTGDIAMSAENPTTVTGDLVVDLQTLETGIGLRDRHMRTKYLEVERGPEFAKAHVREIRLDQPTGKTTFHAVLALHGQTKEVNGTADIKADAGGYKLTASFPVRVSEFGIPEPTYLGVGVKDQVEIRVNLAAMPNAVATTAARRH